MQNCVHLERTRLFRITIQPEEFFLAMPQSGNQLALTGPGRLQRIGLEDQSNVGFALTEDDSRHGIGD